MAPNRVVNIERVASQKVPLMQPVQKPRHHGFVELPHPPVAKRLPLFRGLFEKGWFDDASRNTCELMGRATIVTIEIRRLQQLILFSDSALTVTRLHLFVALPALGRR